MIISVGNLETELVWLSKRVKKLPIEISNSRRREEALKLREPAI